MNSNDKLPTYLPRPGDLPREELIRRAEEMVAGYPCKVDVQFKFTCQWCGERCTFETPNQLFEDGECHKCGKITPVTMGGFSLWIHPNEPKPEPS